MAFANYYRDLYKTIDGGVNWEFISNDLPPYCNNRKMFFFDMNVGFMFGSCLDPNVMYRTNNGGKNWVLNTINNECSKLSTVIKIAFSIENNNYYAYAYNNGSIYKTTFCPVGISTTTNIVGCTDTSANASINVTGLEAPYSYLWDMNTGNQTTQTAINLSTGRYFVTVTANNGCSIVDSVTAFQPNMMSSTDSCINNTWLQKADFGGTARSGAVGFSIDNKGYIGTGHDGSGYKRDFWEYNPGTNTWTQKADFGGKARSGAVGFSISNKGYIGTGQDNSDYKKDFWEYDPINNIWIQKADFGGTAREWAIGFSIGNKGYIGTGYPNLKDFWEYDPINNIWIQKADFGGTARWGAVGFSIGNKGYIGTGYQLNSPYYSKDFWEYNPDNNTWVQKTDFGGVSRNGAVGYSIENNGYIGTGYSTWGYYKDYWEYNPATNTWLQKADFGGTARNMAVGFSIGNKGYIGIGYDGSVKKDFWVYNRINEGFVLCSNDSNANATIFVNGGIPPYSYLWSTGDTSFTTNNLSSGQYQITITDNQGCIIYDTVNIYAPLPVTFTASAINPSCFNSSNGSITVTASGGTGTKQYSKNGGTTYQSSNIFNNLAADTYQIVVKDANNCISSAQSVTITQPDAITFSTTKTDITCNGSNNGTITVTASGGTGQLLYSNNNGSIYQSSNVFSNLTSGTYQIKVKDTNNCVTTAQSVTIINPSAITFTKTKTDITCNGYNDGTITVTASGGTGTLQYSNDNGNSYQSSNVFNGLSGGTYQIVIKDVNNCITTAQSVTIINPAAISFSTSKADVACYGNNTGSITVTANDGTGTLQYSKNNGSTYQSSNIFSSLAAGSYQIVVKDANNCVTSAQTVTITQPSAITFSVSKTDEFCNGNNDGTITVSASGGTGTLLYSKNNGSTYQSSNIFSNLSPGTYQVVVKDANNCVTSAQNITISTTNYEPVFTTHPASQTKCEGENVTFSIAATGTPTPAYQWKKDGYDIMGATGLSLTITGVTTGDAGSYTCTASNVCDTVTSNFAMFIVYTKPLIIQQPASQIKCNGQSVSFTVTATGTTPLLYQWKKDGVNINGATASTYSISSISSGVEGNYTCAISNLCDSILSDTATLTINTPPVITTQPQSQAKCTGDNVTFNVVSTGLNLMYQWKKNNSAISFANSASYTISNIAAGDFGFYTCDIVNPCGSITSDAATLSISTVPGQPGSIIGLNSVCENQSNLSYSINAVAGADSYTWSVPSVWSIISGLGTTAISVNAGTISGNVSVTAGNSCGSGIAQLLAVTVNTFPVATIIPQGDTTFCNGNTVILEANAEIGYTYLWFKDSVSLGVNTIQYTATETGAYSVEISNNGCVDTSASVQVTVLNLPVVTISVIGDTIFCNGDSAFITALPTAGLTFQWFYNNNPINGANDSSLTVYITGVYYVEVTDTITGCSNTSPVISIIVNNNPVPEISVSGFLYSCINDTVILSTQSAYSAYQWSTGDTMPTTNIDTTNIYYVTVHDSNDCIGTDSILVNEPVIPPPQICIALVDSLEGKNLVVWEKEAGMPIESYNVYRYDAINGFQVIGNVLYSAVSKFLDTGSDPMSHTGRYVLTAIDTCGNETVLDSTLSHKTILLLVSPQIPVGFNLAWNHYEGYVYNYYRIYRGDALGVYQEIAVVPSDDYQYVDLTPPPGTSFYIVAAIKPGLSCNPNSKEMGGPFTQSLSNIDDGIIVNINLTGFENLLGLVIYPNPFTDEATIEFNNHAKREYIISVMDVTGKIVLTQNNITGSKIIIKRNQLSPGFYTMELKGDKLYKAKIIIR